MLTTFAFRDFVGWVIGLVSLNGPSIPSSSYLAKDSPCFLLHLAVLSYDSTSYQNKGTSAERSVCSVVVAEISCMQKFWQQY